MGLYDQIHYIDLDIRFNIELILHKSKIRYSSLNVELIDYRK